MQMKVVITVDLPRTIHTRQDQQSLIIQEVEAGRWYVLDDIDQRDLISTEPPTKPKTKKHKRIDKLFTDTQLKELNKLLKVKHLLSQSAINQSIVTIMTH
jgi:hypothetical protein